MQPLPRLWLLIGAPRAAPTHRGACHLAVRLQRGRGDRAGRGGPGGGAYLRAPAPRGLGEAHDLGDVGGDSCPGEWPCSWSARCS